MISRAILAAIAMTFTANTFAQDTGGNFELGMLAGASVQSADGDNLTTIALPSALVSTTLPAIYLSVFPSGNLSIGGEFGLGTLSGVGESLTSYLVGGQATYFFTGNSGYGPYVSGLGTVFGVSGGGDSESEFGAGVGLGNSFRLGDTNLALRIEGRYRRFFDSSLNEFQFLIGFGGRIGG